MFKCSLIDANNVTTFRFGNVNGSKGGNTSSKTLWVIILGIVNICETVNVLWFLITYNMVITNFRAAQYSLSVPNELTLIKKFTTRKGR